jgi:heme-degrading monooxygenase HmoA
LATHPSPAVETATASNGGLIMAVKILIYRKVRPGKEKELSALVKELRSLAIRTPGYISGETLRSIEEPSLHLVISNWKSIEDWRSWVNSSERKALEQKTAPILEEPTRVISYESEFFPADADKAFTELDYSVDGE